jgi:methyl-accepting chemotaxis protein I, serine sensor receptor
MRPRRRRLTSPRYRRQQLLGFASVVAGIAAAFGGWLFLCASIVGPLFEALQHLEEIAGGDLTRTAPVRRDGERGRLPAGIDRMREKIAITIGRTRSGSETMATATRQIAAGNIDLSSRTEEQAASLQETAGSMEELTATVRQNSENAQQGNDIVRKVIDTCRASRRARARSSASSKALRSRPISSRSMPRSRARARHARRHQHDRDRHRDRVTDIMAEISAASHEQSRGIGQVNQAIVQMDQATQRNAALVEQVAVAAGSMPDQAQRLLGDVSSFHVNWRSVRSHAACAALLSWTSAAS